MRTTPAALLVPVLVLAACGGSSDKSDSTSARERWLQEQDNGTRLTAGIRGATRCTAAGGEIALEGEVVTTGSVDSVEILLGVDGEPEELLATIPPQAFVHDGRVKTASYATPVVLQPGAHSLALCLVQSGAQGREPKKTCAPAVVADVACEPQGDDVRDTVAPQSRAVATPAANAHGWNREDVALRFSAEDEGGSGVRAIQVLTFGAQPSAQTLEGAEGTVVVEAEGETTVRYFAVDGAGNVEEPKELVVRIDKTPPTVAFAAPMPAANAAGWNNAPVTIGFEASDALSGIETSEPASPLVFAAEGSGLTQRVRVTDHAGNVAEFQSPAVNLDMTPPQLTGVPASCILWPPNHKLVAAASVGAVDTLSGFDAETLLIVAKSSEPANADGDGNTEPDTMVRGGLVELRAERAGPGAGRAYTVDCEAQDNAGNRVSGSFVCVVPHDQRR